MSFCMCPRCGNVFTPSDTRQVYCSDTCRKSAQNQRYDQNHPRNNQTNKFVAWDGEGEDGKYTLLANSDGDIIQNREEGIPTHQALQFLINHTSRYQINIFYSFGYDIAMILKDIPIINETGGPSLQELHAKGRLNWRGYRIEYLPKKKFTVNYRGRSFVSYDVSSFFQTKFTNVCQDWLGTIPDIISEGKDARDNFSNWEFQKIIDYNAAECKLLVEIMDKFREALKAAGLELASYHGPGALASAWLKKYKIKEHIADVPPEMKDPVMRAYFGGRIEIAAWGFSDTLFHYDINSAYPYALTKVRSLANVDWHLIDGTPDEADEFVLCHIRWECDSLTKPQPKLWGPLPYRMPDGSILYPQYGEGWYWAPEAWAAYRRFPDEIEFIEYWKPEGEEIYPFREPVFADAAKRLQWKKEKHPGNVPVKLALNSLYGKLAQKEGYTDSQGKYHAPPYQCHAWAGFVTAYTRAMLSDALRLCEGNAISVMTDSIWALCDISDKLTCGENLGEWEFSPEDRSGHFCGAGLYCIYDENGNERPKEYKSRGFSIDQGGKLDYGQILDVWKRSLKQGEFGEGMEFTIRRFIGIGQAVTQKKYRPYYGHFIEMKRKLLNVGMYGQTKRLGHVVSNCIQDGELYWMLPCPVPLSNGGQLSFFNVKVPLSSPYKVKQIEEEAGDEAKEIMAAREDEEWDG